MKLSQLLHLNECQLSNGLSSYSRIQGARWRAKALSPGLSPPRLAVPQILSALLLAAAVGRVVAVQSPASLSSSPPIRAGVLGREAWMAFGSGRAPEEVLQEPEASADSSASPLFATSARLPKLHRASLLMSSGSVFSPAWLAEDMSFNTEHFGSFMQTGAEGDISGFWSDNITDADVHAVLAQRSELEAPARPIYGSERWTSCKHPNMMACPSGSGLCCCASGMAYDVTKMKCVNLILTGHSQGPVIIGSDEFKTCDHVNMQTCGKDVSRCCCEAGSAYNVDIPACVPIEVASNETEIDGSDKWTNCDYPNMIPCYHSNVCCCIQGTFYIADKTVCEITLAGPSAPSSTECQAGFMLTAAEGQANSSKCVEAPCPANSHGKDLPSGCTCDAGLPGNIVAIVGEPYYRGGCGAPEDTNLSPYVKSRDNEACPSDHLPILSGEEECVKAAESIWPLDEVDCDAAAWTWKTSIKTTKNGSAATNFPKGCYRYLTPGDPCPSLWFNPYGSAHATQHCRGDANVCIINLLCADTRILGEVTLHDGGGKYTQKSWSGNACDLITKKGDSAGNTTGCWTVYDMDCGGGEFCMLWNGSCYARDLWLPRGVKVTTFSYTNEGKKNACSPDNRTVFQEDTWDTSGEHDLWDGDTEREPNKSRCGFKFEAVDGFKCATRISTTTPTFTAYVGSTDNEPCPSKTKPIVSDRLACASAADNLWPNGTAACDWLGWNWHKSIRTTSANMSAGYPKGCFRYKDANDPCPMLWFNEHGTEEPSQFVCQNVEAGCVVNSVCVREEMISGSVSVYPRVPEHTGTRQTGAESHGSGGTGAEGTSQSWSKTACELVTFRGGYGGAEMGCWTVDDMSCDNGEQCFKKGNACNVGELNVPDGVQVTVYSYNSTVNVANPCLPDNSKVLQVDEWRTSGRHSFPKGTAPANSCSFKFEEIKDLGCGKELIAPSDKFITSPNMQPCPYLSAPIVSTKKDCARAAETIWPDDKIECVQDNWTWKDNVKIVEGHSRTSPVGCYRYNRNMGEKSACPELWFNPFGNANSSSFQCEDGDSNCTIFSTCRVVTPVRGIVTISNKEQPSTWSVDACKLVEGKGRNVAYPSGCWTLNDMDCGNGELCLKRGAECSATSLSLPAGVKVTVYSYSNFSMMPSDTEWCADGDNVSDRDEFSTAGEHVFLNGDQNLHGAEQRCGFRFELVDGYTCATTTTTSSSNGMYIESVGACPKTSSPIASTVAACVAAANKLWPGQTSSCETEWSSWDWNTSIRRVKSDYESKFPQGCFKYQVRDDPCPRLWFNPRGVASAAKGTNFSCSAPGSYCTITSACEERANSIVKGLITLQGMADNKHSWSMDACVLIEQQGKHAGGTHGCWTVDDMDCGEGIFCLKEGSGVSTECSVGSLQLPLGVKVTTYGMSSPLIWNNACDANNRSRWALDAFAGAGKHNMSDFLSGSRCAFRFELEDGYHCEKKTAAGKSPATPPFTATATVNKGANGSITKENVTYVTSPDNGPCISGTTPVTASKSACAFAAEKLWPKGLAKCGWENVTWENMTRLTPPEEASREPHGCYRKTHADDPCPSVYYNPEGQNVTSSICGKDSSRTCVINIICLQLQNTGVVTEGATAALSTESSINGMLMAAAVLLNGSSRHADGSSSLANANSNESMAADNEPSRSFVTLLTDAVDAGSQQIDIMDRARLEVGQTITLSSGRDKSETRTIVAVAVADVNQLARGGGALIVDAPFSKSYPAGALALANAKNWLGASPSIAASVNASERTPNGTSEKIRAVAATLITAETNASTPPTVSASEFSSTLSDEIVGSETWTTCEHPRVKSCGKRCCCHPGTLYDENHMICVAALAEARESSIKSVEEIAGSQHWNSCHQLNMHKCGKMCCCTTGLSYNVKIQACVPYKEMSGAGVSTHETLTSQEFRLAQERVAHVSTSKMLAEDLANHEFATTTSQLSTVEHNAQVVAKQPEVGAVNADTFNSDLGGAAAKPIEAQTDENTAAKLTIVDKFRTFVEEANASKILSTSADRSFQASIRPMLMLPKGWGPETRISCWQYHATACTNQACCPASSVYLALAHGKGACVTSNDLKVEHLSKRDVRRQGIAIRFSERWPTCNYKNMFICGRKCCCNAGFVYVKYGFYHGACVAMVDRPAATAIPGSEVWKTCSYDNMYLCGLQCCCASGYVFVEGDRRSRTCARSDAEVVESELIKGSENWESCPSKAGMYACGKSCCCEQGLVYVASSAGGGECVSYGGRVVRGSESWFSCWHANMHNCAGQCCCNQGYTYTEYDRYQHGACIPTGSQPRNGMVVTGSESWSHCWYQNMHKCGGHCCCSVDMVYVQQNMDVGACVPKCGLSWAPQAANAPVGVIEASGGEATAGSGFAASGGQLESQSLEADALSSLLGPSDCGVKTRTIDGSDEWLTCWHGNMRSCNGGCICNPGFFYDIERDGCIDANVIVKDRSGRPMLATSSAQADIEALEKRLAELKSAQADPTVPCKENETMRR